MRKAIIAVLGILSMVGLSFIPAQAVQAPTAITTLAVPQAPAVAESAANGYAMGVQPNWWTICVANGYGPTAGVITRWNYPGRPLTVNLQNRCDGYSVTNRLTVDNINNSGACIQYTRLNSTAPTKLQHAFAYYYIWNNNPVVYVNTASHCFRDPAQIHHNLQKGVGYILGLAYSTCGDCIMGPDTNYVVGVTNGDSLDANVIYQQ